MGIEIEAKVRVPEELSVIDASATLIDAKVQPVYELLKEPVLMTTKDWYYYPPNDSPAARFREEFVTAVSNDSQEKRILFTTKEKTLVDGVEVNTEVEREISEEERADLVASYVKQGYVDIGYVKIKAGLLYTFQDNITIRAETVWAAKPKNVAHVGNYFEVEQLLNADASTEDMAKARETVASIIELLGFKRFEVETKSWKVLCAEAIANKEK